jgi:hypothetical protein
MDLMYVSLFCGALVLLYKWLTKDFDQLEKQGIPHDKPLPIVGNLWPLFTKKEGLVQFLERNYHSFKNAK